jgi:hypothetical protein
MSVSTTRISAGRYDVVYHAGDHETRTVVWKNDAVGGWQIAKDCHGFDAFRDQFPFARKKDLVQAWADWVATPSLRERGPPSSRRRKDWQPDAIDPFSPRFRYASDCRPEIRRRLTPLGVLVEIESAARHNEAAVDQNTLRLVRDCIAREAPDLVTEDGHVQAPAEKVQQQ